ncbi:hypothetical protein V5O48_004539 [Marasmius crinis-equi]|uniref:Uncharacterized protein n=1 Tax=Marasmius crinis-equi TaxID=585013 RepID=A0ABR3FQ73_9AGAR
MKFTVASVIVALGAITGALADLHDFAWCRDLKPAESLKKGGSYVDNNDATRSACHAYQARNTGSNQWDTCPDCTVGLSGDSMVCRSAGKHIGGDEFEYYCKQAGASGSGAS